MNQKLNHGLHNEYICNLLCNDIRHVDWIITTAFYAALHFIEHKSFPFTAITATGAKYKIKSFDEYYSHFYLGKKTNKHKARLELVNRDHPSIAANYKWLKDACWTARYTNYKFNNEQQFIDRAKMHLEAIKQYCIK